MWERDPVIRWYPGLLQRMMDARFENSAMKILGSILKIVGFKISSQGNSENAALKPLGDANFIPADEKSLSGMILLRWIHPSR